MLKRRVFSQMSSVTGVGWRVARGGRTEMARPGGGEGLAEGAGEVRADPPMGTVTGRWGCSAGAEIHVLAVPRRRRVAQRKRGLDGSEPSTSSMLFRTLPGPRGPDTFGPSFHVGHRRALRAHARKLHAL